MNRFLAPILGGLVALASAAPASAALSVDSADIKRPFTVYNSTGVTTYTSSTRQFVITATLLATRFDGVDVLLPLGAATITMQIKVDNSGRLIGGVSGHDLVMTGAIDLDDDGINEYDGTLLTAEIRSFGFLEAGATDQFDAKLSTTGGSMAGLYGKKIALSMVAENSTFNNSFCENFNGGAKGTVGNLDGDGCPRTPGSWKNECDWPLSNLTLGGTNYSRNQLNSILGGRYPNGNYAGSSNAAVRLAKYAIASKLSLLDGANDPDHIVELLSLADAFLAANPFGTTLSNDDKDYANDLADALSEFVNSRPSGCGCGHRGYDHDDDDDHGGNHGCGRYGGGGHGWGGWGSWNRRH